jgi:hypothetical protein
MSGERATRVVIDVTPRLLEDAVSKVLTDHGLQVVAGSDEVADILVTSTPEPASDAIRLVTVHPAAGGPEPGLHTSSPVVVETLNQLLAAVRTFAGASVSLH